MIDLLVELADLIVYGASIFYQHTFYFFFFFSCFGGDNGVGGGGSAIGT